MIEAKCFNHGTILLCAVENRNCGWLDLDESVFSPTSSMQQAGLVSCGQTLRIRGTS
jgi:E3 ubiquitin-protein ligase DOA10